jgi:hypothetical protein
MIWEQSQGSSSAPEQLLSFAEHSLAGKFETRYLLVDRTEGKQRQRVTLLLDRIQEALGVPEST